jgi:protein-S-isoprenylcysteine O-methyltransferase Ste14
MAALASLCYSLLVYAASLGALGWLTGFLGNLVVPKSIDVGAVSSVGVAVAVNVALIAAFGVQHSAMARPAFKRAWTRIVPRAAERSTYVLATTLALALLMWQWRPIPQPLIWALEGPIVQAILRGVFWLGWALAVLSTFQIDHFELFGVSQSLMLLRARDPRPPEFRTPFLYRYVRHPLYLGLLLAFWATPVMTAGHLLFAAGMTVYILAGTLLEERDLVAQFGNRYREYRAQVGMLLPARKARKA